MVCLCCGRLDEVPAEFLVGEADEGDTSNDLLMAQLLQMEFDKEADKALKIEQDNYNKNSKVINQVASLSTINELLC